MELKTGMLCKHFKGKDLIEKNIYEIIAVNPKYTGENDNFDPIVVYSSYFQEGKMYVREMADFIAPLSEEKQVEYGQTYRVEPLTEDELKEVATTDFIQQKLAYLQEKYGDKEKTLRK